MKKFFALLMALVMVFSLSTVAFAADSTWNGSSWTDGNEGQVTVTTDEGTVGKVYNVVITWGDLAFEYNANGVTWDPEKHEYTGADSAWDNGGRSENAITVANHSNDEVTVATSFTTANKGVSATITANDAEKLDSADEVAYGEYNNADSVTYNVAVSGTPNDGFTSGEAVGTITVTIAAA